MKRLFSYYRGVEIYETFFFYIIFSRKLSYRVSFFFFCSNKKFLFDRSSRRDDLFRFEDIS